MKRSRYSAGFTLIELMVGLVLGSLLMALALPNYLSLMAQAHRGEAKIVLFEAALVLERTLTASSTYMPNGDPVDLAALGLNTSPKHAAHLGLSAKYVISYASLSASSFTLQASPVSPQGDAACAQLRLSYQGAKLATGPLGAAQCWGE